MLFSIPLYNPRRARLLAIGCGIVLFLWLRLEDNTVLPAVTAGLGLSLLATFLWLTNNLGGKTLRLRYALPGAPLLGAVCGLGTAAATAVLMLLKNGMHGHVFEQHQYCRRC
ncbi:MAG: hypothetical protein L0Z53_12955, partial [Acidobacteriales bacterium]|nr:hypothetical protein [Terriglobales bacterium]